MAYSFNKDKGFKEGKSLPVGGYVCKIVAAPKYQKWDDAQKAYVECATFDEATRTAVPFDIVEGEFKDFFKQKFDDDDSTDKKWKGMLYLRHPKDSDKYDTNERRYNSFGSALMESNPSFSFALNHNETLKGKYIGIVFRSKEFERDNGETGSYAEPYSTYPVDDIRSGNFKIPKAYKATNSNSTQSSSDQYVDVSVSEDIDIPFA